MIGKFTPTPGIVYHFEIKAWQSFDCDLFETIAIVGDLTPDTDQRSPLTAGL